MTFAPGQNNEHMYRFSTPSGVCSFSVMRVNNAVRIFGIVVTRKAKILFIHQSYRNDFKTIYVIRNQKDRVALGAK